MLKLLMSLLVGFFCNVLALDSVSSMPAEQKMLSTPLLKRSIYRAMKVQKKYFMTSSVTFLFKIGLPIGRQTLRERLRKSKLAILKFAMSRSTMTIEP